MSRPLKPAETFVADSSAAVPAQVPGKRDPRRNQEGQAMGSKGRSTRRRLLTVTASLLETLPMHDIRVADVARLANTSSATFYLYFRDVPEAALTVINEHSQSTPALLQMIAAPWQGGGVEQARAFVEEYATTWRSQAAIFRARNLAAEAGDPGFYAARELAVRPLIDALAKRIAERQSAGFVPADLHPYATAGVALIVLERLAAVPGTSGRESGITFERMAASAAYLLMSILQGRAGGG